MFDKNALPLLTWDSSGRVRWHNRDDEGRLILMVPEPTVPAALVREFIKAVDGYDPGEFESDKEAMAYSTVNDA